MDADFKKLLLLNVLTPLIIVLATLAYVLANHFWHFKADNWAEILLENEIADTFGVDVDLVPNFMHPHHHRRKSHATPHP